MCLGGSDEEELNASRNREIDKMIRADERKMSKEIKLLLLGAGESGKSTILKQMRLLYASGFSKNEREDYRCIIFSNILNAFKILVDAMDQLEIQFENEENGEYLPLIALDRGLDNGEKFPIEYLKPFKSMWVDPGLRVAVEKGNEFALHDNLSYFFQDIDRLFDRSYVPNDQDILRCRLKTTGITETVFELGFLTYRMFDVGGQRSERKKWIHCFENVNCLMFLVAISGYDQCLVEDKDGNQMQEALMLFESIANSQWFSRSALILFLNKIDLFKKKLVSSPIPQYFPDFVGDHTNPKLAGKFFQAKFKGLNRNPAKDIYTHFTNATDTNLLKITMGSVRDMIIQRNLHELIL
ncbi:MAG: G-Protein alpha subunit [Geoglossum simile]|nr:MAG: G-Protein alpha subunit [Geoglossum simile]